MATIIKREAQQPTPSGPVVRGVAFDFRDLEGHADEYIASVRREAAKIVQEAHAEAKAIRDRAEQAGRAAAEAEIERLLGEKVAGQMQTLRPALDGLVAQLADARGAWLDHWDRSALELASRMAERIVRGELARRPELTLDWLREALELAAGASQITVRLNPEDHANLGDRAVELTDSLAKLADARVVADGGVSRGGCLVETQYGTINQQVEAQLGRLVQDLS